MGRPAHRGSPFLSLFPKRRPLQAHPAGSALSRGPSGPLAQSAQQLSQPRRQLGKRSSARQGGDSVPAERLPIGRTLGRCCGCRHHPALESTERSVWRAPGGAVSQVLVPAPRRTRSQSCLELTNPEATLVGRLPPLTPPPPWLAHPCFCKELCNSVPKGTRTAVLLTLGPVLREEEDRASRTRVPAPAPWGSRSERASVHHPPRSPPRL